MPRLSCEKIEKGSGQTCIGTVSPRNLLRHAIIEVLVCVNNKKNAEIIVIAPPVYIIIFANSMKYYTYNTWSFIIATNGVTTTIQYGTSCLSKVSKRQGKP